MSVVFWMMLVPHYVLLKADVMNVCDVYKCLFVHLILLVANTGLTFTVPLSFIIWKYLVNVRNCISFGASTLLYTTHALLVDPTGIYMALTPLALIHSFYHCQVYDAVLYPFQVCMATEPTTVCHHFSVGEIIAKHCTKLGEQKRMKSDKLVSLFFYLFWNGYKLVY